jgi:nitrogen regulatory protein PII
MVIMLKVEAVVRPERINQATKALEEAGCTGGYYSNIIGLGRQGGVEVFAGRGGQIATRSTVARTVITTVIPDGVLGRSH